MLLVGLLGGDDLVEVHLSEDAGCAGPIQLVRGSLLTGAELAIGVEDAEDALGNFEGCVHFGHEFLGIVSISRQFIDHVIELVESSE